ncbi:MAG: DUF6504 family protein [Syntrophobacteraceae bacterium]
MKFERIEVKSRDEYQGGQDPTAFEWRGRQYEISRLVDRWYEGRLDSTRMPLRYFKVLTSDGQQFILRYHEFFCAWSILILQDDSEA